MYLEPTEKHWALDIEADNLLAGATQIWCVCVINLVTKEEGTFYEADTFRAFLDDHPDAVYVGHNVISYDNEVLKKLWGIDLERLVDTFLLAAIYDPNIQGGHSLGVWGERLRCPKGEYSDFSRLTPEMVDYCRQDTRLCGLLFHRLSEKMRQMGFTEEAIEREHLAWDIIQNTQKKNGFPFNTAAAEKLLAELRGLEEERRAEIYKLWPPELQEIQTFAKAYKKDGSPTANFLRHKEQYPKIVENEDGSYTAWDYVEFNLGSPKQRIEKLLELGWEPSRYTEKGSPQIDEEELLTFGKETEIREIELLAEWLVINSRANNITTWLKAAEKTGRIHGSLFLAGTLRYRHSQPNTANIPRVKKGDDDEPLFGEAGTWTYESRALWYSGDNPDYRVVGVDAKGIQLRILAHHLNTPAFTEAILSEDPHEANRQSMGLPSRDLAKTLIYALLMGAGDKKIADTAQVPLKKAKEYKEVFQSKIPVKSLINRLQRELTKTGRIRLIDRSPIRVPSDHMVIPYLLQGDESRFMKEAMIRTNRDIVEKNLRAFKVADIHDEHQYVVHKDDVGVFTEAVLRAFSEAGEALGFKIPMEGDVNVGMNWAETH